MFHYNTIKNGDFEGGASFDHADMSYVMGG